MGSRETLLAASESDTLGGLDQGAGEGRPEWCDREDCDHDPCLTGLS